MSVRSVAITVAGVRLNLRTDASDDALRAMVQEVEQRLQPLTAAAPGATLAHVHLLAALLLADDLRKARAELVALRSDLTALVDRALNDLDDSLSAVDAGA